MKNQNYRSKQEFDKTIEYLIKNGALPADIFSEGITSLSELGYITSKYFCSRNHFISFFLQKILDEIDCIDIEMKKDSKSPHKSNNFEIQKILDEFDEPNLDIKKSNEKENNTISDFEENEIDLYLKNQISKKKTVH